ncbi:hypothetical protein C5E22_11120 [Pectobacterium parmentieri]|uniref:Uncharacterized protein n=1 Tax=Pectobacterium parmentieri TaxID=1905730 RepID=A0A8B3FBM9_PECPM|nr:hypothetical protein A8F97_07260 [Pectobacterium parmentieri]AYH10297.1 hypothetical protein C5E24_11670 [Pectobacterium parmentieri]AYH18992.1 hypothetical protein C5E22_11120 [Pectobacterium parmentieri]AYH36578.1 hypothetical protein C5E17_11415 [Pectobacterium parmentieri]AZS56722.1 hypothetical protein C5E18_11615 [Pectobacterium parmentieri]
MTFFYILSSILIFIPAYLAIKKITTSEGVYHKFFGILISFLLMFFHFYTYHDGKIPFLAISIEDNDIAHYSSFIFGLISGVVGCIAYQDK